MTSATEQGQGPDVPEVAGAYPVDEHPYLQCKDFSGESCIHRMCQKADLSKEEVETQGIREAKAGCPPYPPNSLFCVCSQSHFCGIWGALVLVLAPCSEARTHHWDSTQRCAQGRGNSW